MKELLNKLGKKGTVLLGGLEVAVEILDVKMSYGRERFLVTPLRGKGKVWVEKVHLTSKKKA